MNSTHLYWEFVQSHKAASVDDPEYCTWVSANVESVATSYQHLLQEKGISRDDFGHEVQSKCKEWKLSEDSDDAKVEVAAAGGDRDNGHVVGSQAGSRLVRDYLWIVRAMSAQGQRDYCNID